MTKMPDFRETVKALVWQFAYRGNDDNRRWLSTGGLSALKDAFKALGWDDPYYVEGGGCEYPGCADWATCGTPTPEGYKHFCGKHYRDGGHDTHRWEAT